MSYGFGNSGNSVFEQKQSQQRQSNNKFTNGVTAGGQAISPSVYKQLIRRATKLGYTLEQFLNLRNQTIQHYRMEPETYIVAKQYADAYGVDIKVFVPYIQRGINDLRFALQDLMNKGVIINAAPGGAQAVEPVTSGGIQEVPGIEEVSGIQEVGGVEEIPGLEEVPCDTTGNIQQINIPNSVLDPMGNKDCNPDNIPMTPAKDPGNNPNTYNQEPFQKIGDGLNPPKEEPLKEQPKQYPEEIIKISQKYQIHPDTLIMLQKNAKNFKGITLDEYIQIAIAANKEGISVLQYYTIYMKNNNRQGSAINSKLKKEAAETDVIVGDLMNQARQIQQAQQGGQPQTTSGVGKKVAYGQSKLDAGTVQEGGFIGSTNIDQDHQQTAYGNGIESSKHSTQPVYGADRDKDVVSGAGRPSFGNEVSGVQSKERLTFGTN